MPSTCPPDQPHPVFFNTTLSKEIRLEHHAAAGTAVTRRPVHPVVPRGHEESVLLPRGSGEGFPRLDHVEGALERLDPREPGHGAALEVHPRVVEPEDEQAQFPLFGLGLLDDFE